LNSQQVNTSLLQLLMTNIHNKLRKTIEVASKHTSFYHAIVPKVKQIQLWKQNTKENIGKKRHQEYQKSYVYFFKA